MRFRHSDGSIVHLAYCTNVHPAEDLDGVVDQLARYAEPVRERLGVGRLGVGLWLARDVATVLAADPAAVDRLRRELGARGLEVVTLNGFPYRGFHEASVKRAVYRPDWTERPRLAYTLDLARILARLLPDDAERGSISSLPLAWREPWTAGRAALAARHLDELAAGLRALAAETGRPVRVGFEPEPGCIVETTGDAAVHLAAVDPAWLGVSLDACHLAVGFEEPAAAIARLAAAGLPIVKLQAACALEVDDPAAPAGRAALATFAEPRFLHQVRELDGVVHAADDLPDALEPGGPLPGRHPWRVHVHLPLHATPPPPVATTRPVLEALIAQLFGGAAAATDHVEVETYTWSVLPEMATRAAVGVGGPVASTPPPATGTADERLVDGLAAELAWARRQLVATGLREVAA
jgi:sugar phosphate isomerase/epimerase